MMNRREILKFRLAKAFQHKFNQPPELLVAAPGRVNLIGEHTDYNDGFVLPCAIDYQTMVAAAPSRDGKFHIIACDKNNQTDIFDPKAAFTPQTVLWKNHIRGIVASFAQRGLVAQGLNIAISGNVPQGAGLSSSASLGVALAKTISTFNPVPAFTKTDFALIAQHVENNYVGVACGIMDQLASACSEAGHAMLLDCRSLEPASIPMPCDLSLLVIHSGIHRGLVDSAYNERRQQCVMAANHYGVTALRDLDVESLNKQRGKLAELPFRRARHVVTENQRCLDAAQALADNDIAQLSNLMAQSHSSMRDDFEITLPAIDNLVSMVARFIGDEGGVRMTGGGFGGCVVVLVKNDLKTPLSEMLARNYHAPDGKAVQIFDCQPSDGVREIAL